MPGRRPHRPDPSAADLALAGAATSREVVSYDTVQIVIVGHFFVIIVLPWQAYNEMLLVMTFTPHLCHIDETLKTSQNWHFYDDIISSQNTLLLDAPLMASSDVAHVVTWQSDVNLIWHATCVHVLDAIWPHVNTVVGNMSGLKWTTCPRVIKGYFSTSVCHSLGRKPAGAKAG